MVTDLCGALRAAHQQCVVTVMPRTDDSFAVWRSTLTPAVYDHRTLGAAATTLRVMAYDQHAPSTAPGPVGGYPWTSAVATYTRNRVSSGKVGLGAPLYGRDWRDGTATTVSAPQARALAASHHRPVLYDATQQAPHFTYRSGHVAHGLVLRRELRAGAVPPGSPIGLPGQRALGSRPGGTRDLAHPAHRRPRRGRARLNDRCLHRRTG
jgi:spore germination protein YaaH